MDRVKKMVHYWCDDIKKAGLTGKGVTVAVLDTGLAPHPDFKSRVVGWRDCIYRKEKCYDDNGHGTHVAGILGGSGQMSGGILSGIAPLCRFVIVKVLDQKGEANVASILAGLKWVEMNHRKYKIRIVNLSAGAGENLEPGKEKMLIEAVEHLWDLGLVVVVSSGNNGPGEGTIAIPGNSRKVITVGAVKTEKAEKTGGEINDSGTAPFEVCPGWYDERRGERNDPLQQLPVGSGAAFGGGYAADGTAGGDLGRQLHRLWPTACHAGL